MKCVEPGCTGTIADGYCDVCGMPAPGGAHSAAAASVAGTPPPAAPPRPATRSHRGVPGAPPSRIATGQCRMPGCSGQVIDGYCDVCGAPAGSSSSPSPASSPASSVTRASNALAATALGSARAGAVSRASAGMRDTAGRLRAARLGAGITVVPPAEATDPEKAILKDPQIPESRRVCPSCQAQVGRARDGVKGRQEGFCPNCRKPYSFTPKLQAGDLVAGQYEVAGALAYGGMGWIYLARDRNVSDRWVVLKGLLNVGDEDAVKATIAEQRFLAQVQHPLIVEIYNFVTHDGAGYIVMEYVGGRSLKELLKQRMVANGGEYDPLPVDWALAFILEALPAFSYLHDQHLLYCDFKPDNVIQVGDSIKLIDLGGVRRMDDDESPIFGTVGFQAPEVATAGPSVASDIFTIGRTLVVLAAEFRGYQTTYESSLPPVSELPVFSQYDSLYRLVLKCCAPDPADRFVSADELRVQTLGVLREVVGSQAKGVARSSATSLLFDPPVVTGDSIEWHQLPTLRPDVLDPQFGWLSTLDIPDPMRRLEALSQAPQQSTEVLLAKCRAALEVNNSVELQSYVNQILANDPWEWRAAWMAGIAAFRAGMWTAAQSSFNAVYGQVPGELAPKLALAVSCEKGGEPDIAENLYLICASTDANYVSPAAFGLARLRSARGDLAGSLAALEMIPSTSRGYPEARRLAATSLLNRSAGIADLSKAMESLAAVDLSPADRAAAEVDVYERALGQVTRSGAANNTMIGGVPATVAALRERLEQAYRSLAGLEKNRAVRYQLVDKANEMRKWSLL